MNKAEKRVLVGMSGGIDSTATCLMLREQGYEIVGLTMWVWGDEPSEARQLAQSMGIEHYVADERKAFREVIVRCLSSASLRNGRTGWIAGTSLPDIIPVWKNGTGKYI